MDTKKLIEKCRDELNNANVLLEKISNALRKYLMNQPLNDEDQALLFRNSTTSSQTPYSPAMTSTTTTANELSDLQAKPISLEKKTPEEYERLLAGNNATSIIHCNLFLW
jgi:hypothetical protein